MERALRVGAGALSDLPSVRGRAGQDLNSADSVTRTRQREMRRYQLIRLSRTYMGESFLVKKQTDQHFIQRKPAASCPQAYGVLVAADGLPPHSPYRHLHGAHERRGVGSFTLMRYVVSPHLPSVERLGLLMPSDTSTRCADQSVEE